PKPVMRTSSPDLRASVTTSKTPSTAFWASILDSPVRSASFWTRSFLFTAFSSGGTHSPQESKLKAGFRASSKLPYGKKGTAGRNFPRGYRADLQELVG